MPEFKIADYGVIGGVLLILLVLAYNLPTIIKLIKKPVVIEEPKTDLILQELSKAIINLTSFLETGAAVDKEKDKALVRQLSDIQAGIDNLTIQINSIVAAFSTHTLKCDLYCHKEGSI